MALGFASGHIKLSDTKLGPIYCIHTSYYAIFCTSDVVVVFVCHFVYCVCALGTSASCYTIQWLSLVSLNLPESCLLCVMAGSQPSSKLKELSLSLTNGNERAAISSFRYDFSRER